MKSYYRVMLGPKSIYAKECLQGNFIGADFGFDMDLTGKLYENWREFNQEFIPFYLSKFPNKSKITAGLACGNLHTIIKGINVGDIVLSPDGQGNYMVGEVTSGYSYHPGQILPHRRNVKWPSVSIPRAEMSQSLKNSTGSIGTISNITRFSEEINKFISGDVTPAIVATDQTIEDPSVFALEKHLEDFLIHNWTSTDLGKNYDIYEVDGELVGQQFKADNGFIDILAISKDKKELLVVELKKGRASDVVVGQILRYMGYIQEEFAETGQVVKGVIIALEDDLRIRRALAVVPTIEFFRYEVKFKLFKN